MLSYDAFSPLELKNEQDNKTFVQATLELLKEYHEYKDAHARSGGAPRRSGQQNAVRLDDVLMKLTAPGINCSEGTRAFFRAHMKTLIKQELVRHAENFDNIQYEANRDVYEFTDDGYQWYISGAADDYSPNAGEYVRKIQTSMCLATATDLAPGLEYLEEGHDAYHAGPKRLLRATGFMIGAASELIVSKVYAELQAAHTITHGAPATSITGKLADVTAWLATNAHVNILAQRAAAHGFTESDARIQIKEFHGILSRIANVIRMDRNNIGHPTPATLTSKDLEGFFGELRHLYQKGSFVLHFASL